MHVGFASVQMSSGYLLFKAPKSRKEEAAKKLLKVS